MVSPASQHFRLIALLSLKVFSVSAIARQQVAVPNAARAAHIAVVLALGDQVQQVRHGHVGAVQIEQRFFSVLAIAVATLQKNRAT